jgi:hypothetical protein
MNLIAAFKITHPAKWSAVAQNDRGILGFSVPLTLNAQQPMS